MNFIDAIATKLPLRRIKKSFTSRGSSFEYPITYHLRGTWISPEYLLAYVNLSTKDVMAKDWIVKRK